MKDPKALGHIIEGVVERNPVTGLCQIMTVNQGGRAEVIDLQELFLAYEGHEVRLALTSMEQLAEISKMVEDGAQGLPAVPFNVTRKR